MPPVLLCLVHLLGTCVFLPAPARGATQIHPLQDGVFPISTHAPREGSDWSSSKMRGRLLTFQPTLPARGATHSAG